MKKIGELITGRKAITLPENATAFESALAMAEDRVGAVLVADGDGCPIGIFTERDLMLRVVVRGLDPKKERIGDHMTRDIFSVSPERTVSDAAHEMQSRHIRHLPVVQDKHVLGLLSLRDLLRDLLNHKRQEVRALRTYIQGEGESAAPH
jgi:signal-transduction protein with cAMP-binding, CBS, and nucleotidyltransferase domain